MLYQFLRKRSPFWNTYVPTCTPSIPSTCPCTCQNNGKACHSSDNDRINESTCHADQPLTYRLFCLCCCCCDRCTTKTCFIGEDSSCNTFLHCNDHGTNHTTGYCTWVKCGFDNCYNCCRNFCNVADDQCNTEHDIDHCHKWYDNLALTVAICFSPPIENRCYTECKNQRRNNNCYKNTVRNGILIQFVLSGSKKFCTALEIPFTWLNVPIPKKDLTNFRRMQRSCQSFPF